MRVLRSENGCPWDKVQTHKSIRDNFIEEAYEACEAIDNENVDNLREELGDVLMQVIFHSQIAEDEKEFTFDDVCDELVKKLVMRHPHVFKNDKASNEKEALDSWEKAKMKIKKQTFSDSVNDVPKSLPSLLRTQKILKRASKSGIDRNTVDDELNILIERLEKFKTDYHELSEEEIYTQYGDLLLVIDNLGRKLDIQCEHALYDSADRFSKRFQRFENLCKDRQIDMETLSDSLIDSLWEEVK